MVEVYNQNNFSTKKLIGYNSKVITRVITPPLLTPTLIELKMKDEYVCAKRFSFQKNN